MKYNKDGIKYRLCAKKNEQGITLIALIVTIVVLLIVAGISIASITSNDAPVEKAGQAKSETEIQAEMEEIQQAVSKASSKSFINGNFSGSADINSIKTALNNSGLIDGSATEETINGQTEIVVTGKKTKTQYSIEANGNLTRLYETGSIKVGDTVNYTPSGTYNWDAEYATSYEIGTTNYNNANKTLDSSTDDFKLTTWKVLNIDNKTGNIELVPSNPTTGTVRLNGAQGYNNGVKLLNDACSNLYSDSSKSITARSININDIEQAIKKGNSSFSQPITTQTQLSELEKIYSWYPAIYKDEKFSVIDGYVNNNTTALGINEQYNFIERTDNIIKSQAQTSIQPYKNYYQINNSTLSNYLNIYKDIILPNGTPTYWISSRFIVDNSNGVLFSLNYIHEGRFYLYSFLYYSGNYENPSMSWSLFPVVTVDYNILEETPTSGTYNVK
ncbi:MAG: prepilin-type N-terminal cleavage/methylation domain-containing protein [Clostridia bacterium]|nr:prepilin-type N-terminal cleavage/methylation domain-containing protein [Clostridia bacterium]